MTTDSTPTPSTAGSAPPEKAGGWSFPGAARKAHFFPAGELISVCGRWMHTGPREAETGHRSPDDCAACAKRLPVAAAAESAGSGS